MQHIIAVDGEGANSFDQALLSGNERLGPPPIGEIGALPADQMAVLMFTSGTTGSPKGVMHCLNSLMACSIALGGRFHLAANDTMLVCSPLGHMTGFAAGMLLGLKIGATVVFQDVWEPKRGVAIMANEGVTYSAGAATFLADMCEAVASGSPKPGQLRNFLCAGAPIPPALIDRVYHELDLKVCSLWGMTECLAGTLTEPKRALEKSSKTDGRPLEGVAVKVLRMDGSPAAVGERGLLKVRGAQMCLGYYKRADMKPFDAEAVLGYARDVPVVVTIEEHTLIGGLGSAVTDALVERCGIRLPLIRRLGIPDVFAVKYGNQDELMAMYGLQPPQIADAVREALKLVSA